MQTAAAKTADEKPSASGRIWHLREAEARHHMAIAQAHEIPEIAARVLAARGFALEAVERFLNPSLKTCLPDPSDFKDMDKAAERLAQAVMAGEQLAVFGDYDVDGATSSALLLRYFRALGLDPLVHIPDRIKEGYGPNAPALLALREKGATIVITVDCGTLSFEPIAAAKEAGLDVIVVDHHQGEARLPAAYAVVNPNRMDETSAHRQLAAVGVTFILIVAINRCLRKLGFFQSRKEPDLKQWLDLVALGTICDVVPLTGVNRALVSQGLKVLAARGNAGICALCDTANVDEQPGVYHAGFVLGPRINAGGRVGQSDLGVRLLATLDAAEAKDLATQLHHYNDERRAIEAMAMEEAMQMAEAQMEAGAACLVIAADHWHPGVIGIIAGRLKERFCRPVAVIALSGDTGKASARSVPGFDYGAAVIAAVEAGILVSGGGHAMAAGFTIERGKVAALQAFLIARLKNGATVLEQARTLLLDAVIALSGANVELARAMDRLAPFGQEHPIPRLLLTNVISYRPQAVNDSHVKTMLIAPEGGPGRLSAIAFRCLSAPLGAALLNSHGKALDVAGQLRLNTWQGVERVSFMVEDVKVG